MKKHRVVIHALVNRDTTFLESLRLRTFAPKNFPRTDFFETLTAGRK